MICEHAEPSEAFKKASRACTMAQFELIHDKLMAFMGPETGDAGMTELAGCMVNDVANIAANLITSLALTLSQNVEGKDGIEVRTHFVEWLKVRTMLMVDRRRSDLIAGKPEVTDRVGSLDPAKMKASGFVFDKSIATDFDFRKFIGDANAL